MEIGDWFSDPTFGLVRVLLGLHPWRGLARSLRIFVKIVMVSPAIASKMGIGPH